MTRHLPHVVIQHQDIKLEAFYACVFASDIRPESAYTLLSVAFDLCAFVAIVVWAYKSQLPSPGGKFRFTGIIRTVVQDATIYFAVIFTSHLILTMFIFFARVCMCHYLFLPPFISLGLPWNRRA